MIHTALIGTLVFLKVSKGLKVSAATGGLEGLIKGGEVIATSPFSWISIALHSLLYVVTTGLAYRAYKKGKITKKQFRD
jgi:hypothetical protein